MDFVETSFYKQTNKKVYLKIGSYQLPHGGFFSSGGFGWGDADGKKFESSGK